MVKSRRYVLTFVLALIMIFSSSSIEIGWISGQQSNVVLQDTPQPVSSTASNVTGTVVSYTAGTYSGVGGAVVSVDGGAYIGMTNSTGAFLIQGVSGLTSHTIIVSANGYQTTA